MTVQCAVNVGVIDAAMGAINVMTVQLVQCKKRVIVVLDAVQKMQSVASDAQNECGVL